MPELGKERFDRTNAIVAGLVFLISFIVYAMTVQPTIPYWDCGEFIACSKILGNPHPPGSPLFIMIGRLFILIPWVADVAFRINIISVISSAFMAMFSYLLTVRMIKYFFTDDPEAPLNRWIGYVGGFCGALFVAFSTTNWGNAVEAEVYGVALFLSVAIVWLSVKYFESKGTVNAAKYLILAFYLALLGVGVHMTVFLVVPTCAILFVLNKDATPRDYLLVCLYIIISLLLIYAFASAEGGGERAFFALSGTLLALLAVLLWKKINFPILIAIGAVSSVMMGFDDYVQITPIALVAILIAYFVTKSRATKANWKDALAILLIAFIGLSVHAFIPVRSSVPLAEGGPKINENNPSKDWDTFVGFLDRKQYGNESMVKRMFRRRGSFENQFGRHANMGYWSYFEEQYSGPGWNFLPFLLLGIIGIGTAVRKRIEIGMPFLTLILLCSVGLILYMNFADGTRYNPMTGDAYLEVRNRDYFFTPAFVFFGVAMGMGVAAVMQYLKNKFAAGNPALQRNIVFGCTLFALLPAISLADNFHENDRSSNYIPYNYAKMILDSCPQNAILFTSGDNDTFPLWALQEAFGYRQDIRIVNLSLINTDWYIKQMRDIYKVPMTLTDDQIIWEDFGENVTPHPMKMFNDRPRGRQAYLQAGVYNGQMVRVSDMMIDEIVLTNGWKDPICFTSGPPDGPLKLGQRAVTVGVVYEIMKNPPEGMVDVDRSYDLYMNKYDYAGYADSKVFRDENATGVYIGVGVSAVRLYDGLMNLGTPEDTARAFKVMDKMIAVYPEYWQTYVIYADALDKRGDSAKGTALLHQLNDTLTAFLASNDGNTFYRGDLGLAKSELGRRIGDRQMVEDGITLLWEAFDENPNSGYSFRKLVSVLSSTGREDDMRKAARMFAAYKINQSDPVVRQLIGNELGSVPQRPPDY